MKVNGSGEALTILKTPGKSLFHLFPVNSLSNWSLVKSKSNAICCTEAVQCHIELNGTVLCTTADVITRE